jgi:peptide/nickel transport system permease protein
MTDLYHRLEGASARNWLGTDDLGRDLFQRLLDGGRVSLLVGVAGAILSAILGAIIGVVAGYRGGRLDNVLMRFTDGVIALPLLPLLIILAAIDPAKVGIPPAVAQSETFSLYRIVVIVALTGWTTVARLVRAETLSLKARDFTRAAQALGARPWRIMLRHILPNAAGSLVVSTTMSIGTLILFESTLSFLGLGIQPPAASWGNMLTGAQELLQEAPMLAVWPGLLIFLTVIAFNFLGDGLQDALDPRSERRT